jgi:phage shock protein PspC (stress-responsive transcriptional regulator)
MILFVLLFVLTLAVFGLAEYALALHISGHSINPFQKKRLRRDW